MGCNFADRDARIAELTTEVADLKSKLDFANAMNADQDKTVAELTAERDLMRASLNLCLSSAASWEERASLHRKRSDDYSAGIYQSLEGCAEEIQDIARNALKEVV